MGLGIGIGNCDLFWIFATYSFSLINWFGISGPCNLLPPPLKKKKILILFYFPEKKILYFILFFRANCHNTGIIFSFWKSKLNLSILFRYGTTLIIKKKKKEFQTIIIIKKELSREYQNYLYTYQQHIISIIFYKNNYWGEMSGVREVWWGLNTNPMFPAKFLFSFIAINYNNFQKLQWKKINERTSIMSLSYKYVGYWCDDGIRQTRGFRW